MSLVTVTFEMRNGQILKCEYPVHFTPGNYTGLPENCYPDESEPGDPTYYIDGKEIDYKDLPKGLEKVADEMLEVNHTSCRFIHTEAHEEPDYDFDQDYDG